MLKNKHIIYVQERFPVSIALVYASLFSLSCLIYMSGSVISLKSAVIILSVFLFLFRLRLLDEIKDHAYDKEFHPHRPVARGLLEIKDIRLMVSTVFLIELGIQFFVVGAVRFLFILLLLYSFLIYKDFFVHKFLKKYLTIELILHEFIFIGYVMYSLSVITSTFWLPSGLPDYLFLLFMVLSPLIYELGRKVNHRVDQHGNFTNDTYASRWGIKKTFITIIVTLMFQALILLKLLNFNALGYLGVTLIVGVALISLTKYEFMLKTSKYWTFIFTTILLLLYSLANLL